MDEEIQKEKRIHVVSKDSIPDSLQGIINHSDEVHYYNNLEDLASFDKMFSRLALFSNFNYILNKMKKEMDNPLLIVEGFNNIVPISQVIQQSSIQLQ